MQKIEKVISDDNILRQMKDKCHGTRGDDGKQAIEERIR